MGASYDVPRGLEDEKKQKIKVVVKPSIPNNNINWQVFEYDAQNLSFLQNEVEFSVRNQLRLNDQYGDQIINLSSKKLLKGLNTLESFFNPNNQVRERGMNLVANKRDHVLITVTDGKTLNLGNVYSKIEQENFVHMC